MAGGRQAELAGRAGIQQPSGQHAVGDDVAGLGGHPLAVERLGAQAAQAPGTQRAQNRRRMSTSPGCARMLIDNVTIKTSRDGINLSQCSDVEIANCHIDAVRFEDGYPAGGDDAIKLGSELSLGKARISENISVRNCFLASGCNAIQFGSETMAPFRNIRFENIRIVRAGKAGISITSNDGSVIEGLHFLDISMEKTFAPIFIKLS